MKDFYETGMSYINNVSVAGGGEKADFRLSFTSTNQTGVVPGSDYNKYAFSVNAGMNFTSNFQDASLPNIYVQILKVVRHRGQMIATC